MNGWWLALFLGGVGVGYLVRFMVCVLACSERTIRLRVQLLAAEANQDHALCKHALQAKDDYIASLEARLDALEPATLEEIEAVAEAERITRGDP